MELPYELAFRFCIYPKKWKAEYQTCLYIKAALFTIVKSWKQPKNTSRDEQRNKMWHIRTAEYYSVIKKEWSIDTYEWILKILC